MAVNPAMFKMCREREHTVSVSAFVICAIFTLPLCIGIKSPVLAVISLSMIYALVSVINTSILSIYPMRYADTGNVASVSGLMDFATYGGGGISAWIFGSVRRYVGYTPVYVSWAVICVVSVIILRCSVMKNEGERNAA